MARTFSRRELIAAAAIAWPGMTLPGMLRAAAAPARELAFRHTHTSEKLRLVYWEQDQYVPDALAEIDHLLRDFRTGDVHRIDTGVLDMLYAMQSATGRVGHFEVISGYRSPKTNAMLAVKGGVARKSLHMQGRALDVRLPGVATNQLRDAAIALRSGGVGYYANSDFVHIDTGRFRTW